ncbi:MAG: hypothetical protein VKJ05_09545 [Synechococcaceae cyanobacterium]|nr:hypothetical protein [Synechococcaceae cyanobacterium]
MATVLITGGAGFFGSHVCLVADPCEAARLMGWGTRRDLAAICADGWAWQSANPNGYGA